jgi:CubicO group peptidase (beta-lactamase class C family)
MTKMVTSIACLQLAEQGKVDFDDAEVINKHLPELVAQPILEGFEGDKATTTQRTQPITLRRLLTHTSGLGYGFLDPVTQQYVTQRGRTGPLDGKGTVEGYTLPLRFEPGSHFMYGVGIDWAGILVERLTGQNLDEYFQEHIFRPIGVRGLTFYPTDDIKRDLMQMCGRGPDGKLVPVDGMRPIAKLTPEDIGQLGGGGGLLGTLHNYLLVTQEVLRCLDGNGKILNKQSAEKMFQDALPPRSPDYPVHTDLGKFMGMLGSTVPDQLTGHAITHSLAFSVNTADSPYGRRAGSGAWGGAARTIYWIDPKSGICVSVRLLGMTDRHPGCGRNPDF